jgi:hypothetical protein
LIALLLACSGAGTPEPVDTGADTPAGDTAPDSGVDTAPPADTGTDSGTASDTAETGAALVVYDPWPFADGVHAYSFGEYAGYGQENFPNVVFGPPESPGNGGGSLDVLSLGAGGEIVVTFRSLDVVDGPGVDLLVFENPFSGWAETGVVGVSEDGETWVEWPCAAEDAAGGYPGCAGVALVYASSTNGVDARDPDAAGGDRFDLADIGVARARYVRIRDSGANSYAGVSGGFDLDAVAIVHGETW